MDADRWQQISRLITQVLERSVDERRSFLDAACGGDEALRGEVDSLLANEVSAQAFLVAPAAEVLADRLLRNSETLHGGLEPGVKLGSYQIERPLGRGGMGVVFLAHDATLHRQVALKVLGSPVDGGTARAQLVREARNAAALNHPNICTVYEVGEANGRAFIAMEYVDGYPLSDRLTDTGLPLEDAVRYGTDAADALAYAHDHGVIHRDLKAANAMVTTTGRLKLVDFGLARRDDALLAGATTIASLAPAGVAVGTPYSMAPEQVRGGVTDARTDIWALGVLLYEMVSGAKPFTAPTIPELFSSILRDAPVPLPDATPLALRSVIERCLEKGPERRYEHARDVRAALESIRAGAGVPQASPVVYALTRRRAIWVGGAAAVCAVSGLAAWGLWPGSAEVRSLAVLPFQNALDDEEIDYLCDGVTESLIRQLANIRSLKVTSLSAVLNFKGQAVDPREAGRQLGLDTVLAGTLTREMGRLLITAELVDVASGDRLWSNKYDRDAADLLSVQDEIAGAIMDDGLRLRLSSDERSQLVRNPTADGEAYDLYLQSRHLQRRATAEDYLNSRELLRRAIVRDPKFALAYVALSGNYAMMAVDGLERPTDAWPQTNRHVRQALELEPGLKEARAIEHSRAFFFDWDWEGAARERATLLQIASSDMDPQYLRTLAAERWALGRADEAVQLARRMRELDPLSSNLSTLEADYLGHAGQLDAAVDLYETAIQRDPADPNPYFGLSEVLYKQRRFDEAIEARRQAHAAAGDEEFKEVLATARGEAGYLQIERARVRVELDLMKARAVVNYVSPLEFGRTYAQLGEKEQAFQYLDAAFVDRSPGLVFLKVDRAWDNIRDDPRFAAAVRRVGLP